MGYHLTILRSAHGKQDPIPLDEAAHAARKLGWDVEDTPTFSLRTGGGTVTVWHQHEELWTKNPEDWGIAPMVALADGLNARVRGEEFETYAADGTTFLHPDDVSLRQQAEQESNALVADSLRDQKRIRNVIVGFFAVVAAIAYLIGKSCERT